MGRDETELSLEPGDIVTRGLAAGMAGGEPILPLPLAGGHLGGKGGPCA